MSASKKSKQEDGAKQTGRPTLCTPEVTEAICARLAGGESLRAICRTKGMPHVATVCRWVVTNEVFREQYMQAREAAGYAHADKIIEVVELLEGGLDPQAARAMMDGLKWAAERMAPKTHSPKHAIDHTSSDGSLSPTRIVIEAASDDRDDTASS